MNYCLLHLEPFYLYSDIIIIIIIIIVLYNTLFVNRCTMSFYQVYCETMNIRMII
jgi:hypothetical protein